MKRGRLLVLAAIAVSGLGLQGYASEPAYIEDHVDGIYYEIPNDILENVTEGDQSKTYEGEEYFLGVVYTPLELDNVPENLQTMLIDTVWSTIESEEGYKEYDSVYGTFQEGYSVNARYVDADLSGSIYEMYTYAAWCGNGVGLITVAFAPDIQDVKKEKCREIYEHIGETLHTADWMTEPTGLSFDEELNYEHAGSASSVEKNTTDSTAYSATMGEINALMQAKSYLSFTAFSYSGLIEQLEYEGYSHDEAVYGADNCGADWNEQAAKQAKSYLSYTSFSRSSLIEQLEYEGFTHDQAEYGADHCGSDWDGSQTGVSAGMTNALKQAESYLNYTSFSYTGLIEQLEYEGYSHEEAVYGADNCGADWNEQAAKKAESYLSYTSFSRSGLIEQLEYEGFTHDQAEYGASAVGY